MFCQDEGASGYCARCLIWQKSFLPLVALGRSNAIDDLQYNENLFRARPLDWLGELALQLAGRLVGGRERRQFDANELRPLARRIDVDEHNIQVFFWLNDLAIGQRRPEQSDRNLQSTARRPRQLNLALELRQRAGDRAQAPPIRLPRPVRLR